MQDKMAATDAMKSTCNVIGNNDMLKPFAREYFSFKESKLKFSFSQPGPIEGV